jgi:hypothetical protein
MRRILEKSTLPACVLYPTKVDYRLAFKEDLSKKVTTVQERCSLFRSLIGYPGGESCLLIGSRDTENGRKNAGKKREKDLLL